MELTNDVVRPKAQPQARPQRALAEPEAVSADIPAGHVKVRVRGASGSRPGGVGKIFTGETDPHSKTNPFPTYPAGAEIWVSPEAADKYDANGWVLPVDE